MGEVSYRPLIDEMTWSCSRIECFSDCPYQFFLKYISRCEDRSGFYSSYGKFMHALLEKFYKGEISKEEMQIKFLFDFQNEVKGDRPDPGIVRNYIRQGSEYLKQLRPLPFRTVAVEKKIRFRLDCYPFVGIVDYIGRHEDGSLVIVDHKSRAMKPRSGRDPPTAKDRELDEALRQLYLYAEAVRQEYGCFPSRLCFNCFRTGTLIEEPFREDALQDAVDWAIRGIHGAEEESDFPPRVEFFKCGWLCGVRDECCYWKLR